MGEFAVFKLLKDVPQGVLAAVIISISLLLVIKWLMADRGKVIEHLEKNTVKLTELVTLVKLMVTRGKD